MSDPAIEEGWVAGPVADEHPELRLRWIDHAGGTGRSSPELQQRLALLSDRFRGAQAVTLRREPVPHAYRAFFRAIGLDPDETRTPVEAAALERLVRGGFAARERVADALLLALVETRVPVWALDAGALDGPLGIREAVRGDRLGEGPYAPDLAPGRLVVADAARPVAVLFGALAASHLPGSATTALRVFTVQVAGVPDLHAEEALWTCAEALDRDAGRR
jgi:DNA/RNA-binding domain of Phe-tRNA-synthetase-like protein